MPFQDILLQLDSYPDPTPAGAIDQAVRFAQALDAKVSALAVQVDIPLRSNPLADRLAGLSQLKQEWEAKSLEGCQDAVRHFEAAARDAGVFGGHELVRINLYGVDDVVARRARTRDLCLVPLADRYDGQLELAQTVIFQSGRPVLAYRADQPILQTPELQEVVVAWDGSRSAARALADALPLLQRAKTVRVTTFLNEKESAAAGAGAEAIRHLQVHGVSAKAEEVDTGGARIGKVLDRYLKDRRADLLVMGAYGHSRTREFILGGATEHVLRSPPTAVFLCH